MWAIIPAAGAGSRIQPLAFSKELLPVGSRIEGFFEKPRAVSEYLIDRMIKGGADKICFIISPGKSDIMEYYGSGVKPAKFCFVVQQKPAGLCDSIFCALPFINDDESVIIGLPDTIWFPDNGYLKLPDEKLSFLLFPVEQPELFDSVIMDGENNIIKIEVKQRYAKSKWIWGAIKLNGRILKELHAIWLDRKKGDEYIGTLINAYLQLGGSAVGIKKGSSYVDVGTINGYREAINLLYQRNLQNHDV